MHREAYDYVQRTIAGLPRRRRVVEIGAYNVNGSVRSLFPDTPYTGIDLRQGNGVDVVADGAEFTPQHAPDTVIATEVLEHAVDPQAVILNAFRILKTPGVLILTAAGPERTPHGNDGGKVGSEHYANIDPDELSEWLEAAGFADVSVERNSRAGDVYAIASKVPPVTDAEGDE